MMWRRLLVTAALIIAGVTAVSAQAGTADGIVALMRGDYQRAVEILKPMRSFFNQTGESWSTTKPRTHSAASSRTILLTSSIRLVPPERQRAWQLNIEAW